MKNKVLFTIALLGISLSVLAKENPKNVFPHGKKIPAWFLDKTKLQLEQLGKQFITTNFGAINDSMALQTAVIQNLVNAYGVDGFSISGKGMINGNGPKYWESFWQRRRENKNCTNLEVSRPRLVFIWNCKNVQVQDVKLHNSGFWTSHYYKCNDVKILDLHIFSPHAEVKAPSTDAIDLDACSNVLISGCYISVNDDAIALKGGKGPWADKDPNNGENTNMDVRTLRYPIQKT